MAQHDYIIANQSGAAFRSDLNNGLAAIVSQNSGAAQPSTTYAYQWWADTTTGLLKIRNAANNAWITLFQLDGEWTTLALENGTAAAPSLYFKDSGTDTGIFSPGADQLAISTGGVRRLLVDASGNLTASGGLTAANLNGGPLAGFRNRIINGAMNVNQRGSSSLSSGLGTITYLSDRWYGYATGAAVNLSLVSAGFRVTGAASNTVAVVGQRIESANSADLAGSIVTLSFIAASSNSIALSWKVSYANSADNFALSTQSNSGTVSTTQSPTAYSATFTLNGAATTGLQVEFFVNNYTSGTFDINHVQLEPGPVATPFERQPIGTVMALCQRYAWFPNISYYEQSYGSVANANLTTQIYFPVTMRATPTINASWGAGQNAYSATIAAMGPNGAFAQLGASGAGEFAATINWYSFTAEL